MYTLRIIELDDKERIEMNHSLGESYSYVDRIKSPKLFFETYLLSIEGKPEYSVPNNLIDINSEIKGIIESERKNYFWIQNEYPSFIMTPGGQTFQRLN